MKNRILLAALLAGFLSLGGPAMAETATPAASAAAPSSDEAVVAAVKTALAAKPELKAETLNVTSKHGEVTIAGTVENSAQLYSIAETAQKVPGVKWINNEMVTKE